MLVSAGGYNHKYETQNWGESELGACSFQVETRDTDQISMLLGRCYRNHPWRNVGGLLKVASSWYEDQGVGAVSISGVKMRGSIPRRQQQKDILGMKISSFIQHRQK